MNYFSLKILSCLSFSSAFSLSSLGVWSSSIFFPVLIQFLQTSNKLFVVNVRKCYSGFHSSPALCPAAPAPADCRPPARLLVVLVQISQYYFGLDWLGDDVKCVAILGRGKQMGENRRGTPVRAGSICQTRWCVAAKSVMQE